MYNINTRLLLNILISLIAAVVGLEFCLRGLMSARAAIRKNNKKSVKEKFNDLERKIPAMQDFKNFDKSGIYYQDFVGYLQKPFKSRHFNINSEGFRCHEFTRRKMDGRFRIIIFGSSGLLGVPNCSDDQTIAAYLQKLCDDQGLPAEILNLGVRSYLIMNELNLMYRINLDTQYDGIIVFDGYNDVYAAKRGNVYGGYPRITNYLSSAWTARIDKDRRWFKHQMEMINKEIKDGRESFFCKAAPALCRSIKACRIFSKQYFSGNKNTEKIMQAAYAPSRKFYIQHAGYMMLLARSENKKIVFCHQPSIYTSQKPFHPAEQTYYDYSWPIRFQKDPIALEIFKEHYFKQVRELEALCRKNDVPNIDINGAVNDKDESAHIFHDYCHLTPGGNSLVADELFKVIREWIK